MEFAGRQWPLDSQRPPREDFRTSHTGFQVSDKHTHKHVFGTITHYKYKFKKIKYFPVRLY